MRQEDIVKLFLNSGFNLDYNSLKFFSENPEKIETALAFLKKMQSPPKVITQNLISQLFEKEIEIKILQNFQPVKKDLAVEELSKLYTNRYEKIKNFLKGRLDLVNPVSINRISEKTKNFSIVAMVKEISQENIVVEDPTGVTTLHFRKKQLPEYKFLTEDEVVGFSCSVEEGQNYISKIIWPDIPLKKEIPKSTDDVTCIFLSDFYMDEKDFEMQKLNKILEKIHSFQKNKLVIFLLGGISKNPKDIDFLISQLPKNSTKILLQKFQSALQNNVIQTTDPSIVEVSGVKLFVSHGKHFEYYQKKFEETAANTLLALIKKRHLDPTMRPENIKFVNDELLLEDVPDIFCIGYYKTAASLNYKGITIYTNGSLQTDSTFWAVNLKTRETIKIQAV
jgi:DNA polymerase II small subunit/DNA polymerase delta subunit B